jgi:tubulin polyglutamylase TTLL6/13
LGFDIFLDSGLKPWLIEVNHAPSFATDAHLDYRIKKELMEDTFSLLNLSTERKREYIKNLRAELKQR